LQNDFGAKVQKMIESNSVAALRKIICALPTPFYFSKNHKVMRKILVPIDFSAHGVNAAYYAAELAKAYGAEVRLVHVTLHLAPEQKVPPVSHELTPPEIVEHEHKHTRPESLGELEEAVKAKAGEEVKVSSVLKSGNVDKSIQQIIDSYEPDLVVLGVAHHSELFRLFVGSTAEKIVDTVTLPVLAVPENVSFKAWNKVIFASDFEKTDGDAIVKLREVAFPHKFDLQAVHMVEGESYFKEELDEIKQQLEKHLKEATWGEEIDIHLIGGMNVLKNLDLFLERFEIDLLVFSTHKRNFFEKMIHPSMTKQMMSVTHIPMLIVHT
jgi:nucleotide-binding universal stress UspA family protein